MATEITYVGVGAASATDGGSNPTPAIPSGIADNDLMICTVYSRESDDGTISISAGWTQIYNERSFGGIMASWYRYRVAADPNPTITLANHAVGDTVIAQIAAWRGVLAGGPFATGVLQTNTPQLNIGPIPSVGLDRKGLVIVIGGKQDDWGSVATLTGDSLNWAEIAEDDSTLGNDAGLVWNYAVSEQLEIPVTAKTFSVTTGLSTVYAKGFMVSFSLDAPAFVAADDVVLYSANSHPTADGGSPGGEIDSLIRATFAGLAADDDIEVLSSSASDTTISVSAKGRDAGGALVQESAILNGVTAVILSTMGVIERLESIQLSGPAVGTVTVRRSVAGATIGVIPIGELGFRRIFSFAYPHPTSVKDYYEKVFFKNIHPVQSLGNAIVSENADPEAVITFTLATAINDSATVTNRLTVPDVADTDPDTFDGAAKNVPGLNLDPGDAIGVWLKMAVTAADTPFKNTYTLDLDYDLL